MERTLVTIILDESGSMESIKRKTIDGFNEYIDSLKKHGNAVRVTFNTFNTRTGVKWVFYYLPTKDVPKLTSRTYRPDALTPLYDAIGETFKDIEAILKKSSDTPAVLVVIITDGQENSSKLYNRQEIFDKISEKEGKGWTFMYLGANQDAWEVGGSIGILSNNMNYRGTEEGITNAFANVAASTDRYFGARSAEFASKGSSLGMSYNSAFEDLDKDIVEEYENNINKRSDGEGE